MNMAFRWFLCISCACGSPILAQEVKKPAALPAKLSGFSDSGEFHLCYNEEIIAKMKFTWKEDGAFENTAVMEIGGIKFVTDTTIAVDKQGLWTKIEGTARFLGKFKTERKADQVKIALPKKDYSVPMKAATVLFDNHGPALMAMSVRAYDAAKGGKQKIPMLVIPAALLDATLERKDAVERSVAGKDVKLTRYVLGIGAVAITVWAGADAKVYLAEVPSQSAAYVRVGYEALRKVEVADPLLSRPQFNVKEELNVRVAMRDGVKLATDIYRPDQPGKHPAILIRTPYQKEPSSLTGRYYARRGYVVAVQDCRGRFSSEGVWEPFINEANDGYDTIEWLAAQSYANGKVGMIGASYVGWVQWWAASARPPHLVTIIPNVAPPEPFFNIPYENGVFYLFGAMWWARVLESNATGDLSGEKLLDAVDMKLFKRLRTLPVIDLDKAVLGKENTYWRRWIEHPTNDAYWQPANFHQHLHKVNIPVFHQSGWFDGDGIGSKLNYAKMTALGHPHQKLTLGPWGHTDTATRSVGKRDFGPQALRDLPRDYLRWFDYWLKGIDNGVLKEPLVSIFVMNSNKWLYGPKYPLPETRFEKWYLASGGKANTSLGDGKLTRQPPAADAPADRYSYDPGDPTPDPNVTDDEKPKKLKKAEKKDKENAREEVTKSRRDLLVYVTEPFQEEYTFAGPVSAVLYASSSAKDTDWVMRLLTVDPKGEFLELGEGRIRARFRASMSKPSFLEPGQVYEYTLDLWQTGISVPKGHRLRVEVASASFPVFSRNLNTGGHNEKETKYVTAYQTVHHNADYPSHVLLPMIRPDVSKK